MKIKNYSSQILHFSTEIAEKILQISEHNKDKKEELAEWHNSIDGLISHISNPVIAWDNTDKCKRERNGVLHLKELGEEGTYTYKGTVEYDENLVIPKTNFGNVESNLSIPAGCAVVANCQDPLWVAG